MHVTDTVMYPIHAIPRDASLLLSCCVNGYEQSKAGSSPSLFNFNFELNCLAEYGELRLNTSTL